LTALKFARVELHRRRRFIYRDERAPSQRFFRRAAISRRDAACKGNCMRWRDALRILGHEEEIRRRAMQRHSERTYQRAHNAHGQLFPLYRAKVSRGGERNPRRRARGTLVFNRLAL